MINPGETPVHSSADRVLEEVKAYAEHLHRTDLGPGRQDPMDALRGLSHRSMSEFMRLADLGRAKVDEFAAQQTRTNPPSLEI